MPSRLTATTDEAHIHAAACALGCVVFSAYYATLCPSVPGGDSGELIQVAIEGGVAHPPGYPTWTMLAHAFASFVPYGEPAWRINLSSAVCGSLAAFFLAAGVGLWVSCAWTGVAAGGAFAFAPLVWEYAVQGEVFALNNFNNALLFYLLVRYARVPSLGGACAGAFAIGLALCNQHTMVFYCVPYAAWALFVGRRFLLQPRALAALALSGLLGLLPYAYLPFASGRHAAWGSWGDQRSVSGFLIHVLRREYGTFRLANTDATTNADYLPRLQRYFTSIPTELPPLGAPLCILGLLSSLLTVPGLTATDAPVGGKGRSGAKGRGKGEGSNSGDDKRGPSASSDGGPTLEFNVPKAPHGLASVATTCASPSPAVSSLSKMLLGAYLFYVLLFNYLSNLPVSSDFYLAVQQRFWPQAHLVCCAWYALGVRHLVAALCLPPQPAEMTTTPEPPSQQPAALSSLRHAAVSDPPAPPTLLPHRSRYLYWPGLALVAMGLSLVHYRTHYAACDLSATTVFRDFGVSVLAALPDQKPKGKVVLLTLGDEVLNAVRYAHRQLGHRPNVTILDLNYMQFEWFVERVKHTDEYAGFTFPGKHYGSSPGAFVMSQLLDANYDGRSFFVCGGMHRNDQSWEANFRLWPVGLVMQILKRSGTIRLDKWASRSKRLLPRLAWPSPPLPGSWAEVLAKNHYLAAFHQRPYYVLQYAYESLQLSEQLQNAMQQPGQQQVQRQALQEQALAHRQEALQRFLLAGRLYEETSTVSLNGSRSLPDYYYRNWGVAYSQIIGLEPSEEGRAGAKQHAAQAFMAYLKFELEPGDRTTVEHGVLSLIPPPQQRQPQQRQPETQQEPPTQNRMPQQQAPQQKAAQQQQQQQQQRRRQQQQQQRRQQQATPKKKKKRQRPVQ